MRKFSEYTAFGLKIIAQKKCASVVEISLMSVLVSSHQEVGMGLRWKLKSLMKERKISNKQLAETIGVHRNTVLLLKGDAPTMIRFKHLESLCETLDCQPSDLIEFVPESEFAPEQTETRQR